MWEYNYNYNQTQDDELYHYGVIGMKWGVRRANRKAAKNERLERKALKYDLKSAKATKKSEKIHAKRDLGAANRAAKKASKYAIKSKKIEKKAMAETDEIKKLTLEKRAAKYDFKRADNMTKANKISKQAGYGKQAMKYSIKSDKLARKAAKARYLIANNNRYIATMNKKMNSVSQQEIDKGREFING